MHNFLSVSNLHMKNTFYIATSNHFIKRSTCHINIQGDTTYQNNAHHNNAHHNKHSLSKQSPHFGQRTNYKLQITNYKWTKAPQYNKCWNLEIFQDNSKALAGRCLEILG